MNLVQTNGLLATRALKLEKWSRIPGNGKSLVLQQGNTVSIQILALKRSAVINHYFKPAWMEFHGKKRCLVFKSISKLLLEWSVRKF